MKKYLLILLGFVIGVCFTAGYLYITEKQKNEVYETTSKILQEHSNLEEVYIKDHILYIKLREVNEEISYLEHIRNQYDIKYHIAKELKKVLNVENVKIIN